MTNEQLVARIKAGENEAESMLELWQQNQLFIYKQAMKYQAYAEIDDLNQEGYIGLCEAVQHYDPEQGVPFISYAAFWIKQVMQRYIDNCCSVVRIPVGVKGEVLQYKKIVNEYLKCHGKEPTDVEIQALMYINKEKLDTIKKNAEMVNIRSLSEPVGDENDCFLGDMLASDQDMEEDIAKRLDAAAMKEMLWCAVDGLPYNMPDVLRSRYQDNITMREVSERLGITESQANTINNKALKKLRIPSKCAPFRGYYEQYLSSSPVYHVGVAKFNRTWSSAVEAEVLRNEYR